MSDGVNPLRAAVRACRKELFSAAFFTFFTNLLVLALPIYILNIFLHVLQSQSKETLVVLTLIALFAMAVYGFLTMIRNRILNAMAVKLDTLLGETVHSALIARAARSNDPRNVQGLRDLATVRNLLAGQELQAMMDAPWALLFLFVIFLLHPAFGTLALLAILLLVILAFVNDRISRPALDEANAAAGKTFNGATANVRNAEVIQGMGMRPAVMARWREQNATMLRHLSHATETANTIAAISRAARMIIQILIFAVGAWLVISRAVSPGAMMAAVFLMARVLAPLEAAISSWKQIITARQSYRRLDALLQFAPSRDGFMPLPAPRGQLSVEQVFLAPRGVDRPILRNVSFSVEAGMLVGIIGASAAGKSSLAKTIVGVWKPTSGVIRLDSADVYSWDPDDLGQYIGYMPQDVELFEGSVRDNIARMAEGDPEQIIDAALLAGAHEMILRLPEGYETNIGDNGGKLSGGQRQRIALARAFYGNPRLLVLDEPNANLDAEGEEALVSALAKAKDAGVTALVVAHRPSLLANADRLLVLKDGRVEMYGPRSEVLGKVLPRARRGPVKLVKSDGAPMLTDQSATQ